MLISFMPLSDSSNLLKQLYVSSTPELLESHFLVRPVGLQFLFNSSYSRVSRRNLHLTAWRRGLELKQARGLADHRAVDRPVRQPPARFPPPRATPGFRRLPVWCTRLHCSKFATCQIIVRTSRVGAFKAQLCLPATPHGERRIQPLLRGSPEKSKLGIYFKG